MSEFMYLFRGPGPGGLSPQQSQAYVQKWRSWIKALTDKGRLKDPGAPLERKGKLVRGSASITDGPFAEKDIVGGYIIVEAQDVDEAARLAEGSPIDETGGLVEVRPIMRISE
jgi:hypothetical protein